MAYFPRFLKRWASTGTVTEPTEGQTDAGFAHLGPNPPTVEEFNALFQWLDDKDGWLFRQIKSVLDSASITAAATPDTQLRDGLAALYGGGGVLAANGWQRLPGGLIIQWGGYTGTTGALVNGVAEVTGFNVTFPIAFTTAVYSIVATAQDVSGAPLQEHAWYGSTGSLVQFSGGLSCRQASTTMVATWIAVGK